MIGTLTPARLVYFGKIPTRGDFIRSPGPAALIKTMDQWLSQGLETMAQDAHWKTLYDQAWPIHFAFLGTGSHAVLAGHLAPSTDQSGRRFPLITAGTFDSDVPAGFTARAPMALNKLWIKLAHASQQIRAAADATHVLGEYLQQQIDIDADPVAHEASYRDFLELQTVGTLQGLLQQSGHELDLRLSVLALGLLMEAVPTRGRQPIDKGLCLPLPTVKLHQPYVATFWLDLIARFLKARTDLEIALYLPQPPQAEPPLLYLSFSGGSAQHLSAMLDPRTVHDTFVDMRRARWAEAHASQSYNTKKLSSYLQQPQLSLQQAARTFHEAFLGE